MAMLPENFIRQVQQATDIVDLIGRYVKITKRGKDFLGLCPFHEEKTPSFSVSPSKQIFKCFGCGAGGGAFQFVMRHQNLPFPEAVIFLADQAGIAIPQNADTPAPQNGQDRVSLLKLTQFAADFFRRQLQTPDAAEALKYARHRGLTDDTIEKFAIGYAPAGWDGLRSAARTAGFSDAQLIAAGLAAPRENSSGCYDRFRNRLIFPICDQSSRVIAFGGRALDADEKAKYINSPETPLFDKSANLYGLDIARRSISSSNSVIVVEGYFDVVMPSQAGVENICATLGTALTERHVRILSRMASDVILLFDSDSAGQAAAERALELFIAQKVNVRIATIPQGKDPCDFVLAGGPEAFNELIEAAPDALEFAWQARKASLTSDSLVDKNRAVDEFLALMAGSSAYGAIDQMRQGMLINKLSHILAVDTQSVAQRLKASMSKTVTTASAPREQPDQMQSSRSGRLGVSGSQRRILEILICDPEQFEFAARHIAPDDFLDPVDKAVAKRMWQLGEDDELSFDALLAMDAGAQWGSVITDMEHCGQQRGNFVAGLASEIEYIDSMRQRKEVEQLKSRTDDESLKQLTQRSREPNARRRPF